MLQKNVAVLVGNGLSVAFNPELGLIEITEEVLARLKRADGDDVVTTMREIAERTLPGGVTSADDFEELVGAFGSESQTLGDFGMLADLKSPQDTALREAIQRVARFAEKVRDTGVSHVLEVICERSRAPHRAAEGLQSLIADILKSFPGNVTFGNLNYDTLLLATLMRFDGAEKVVDLGDGRKRVGVVINGTGREVQALRKRAEDFPADSRVLLLHLHGSLTYWASPEGDRHAKLPRELLSDGAQWQALRDDTTDIRPTVVLANARDKAQHVTKHPFDLAYRMFSAKLETADHWLIVGYSFRDAPVNAMLAERFAARADPPRILVVTHGKQPSRRRVLRVLGWAGGEDRGADQWLTFIDTGANGAQDTAAWKHFADK